jgi:hypothetical protein
LGVLEIVGLNDWLAEVRVYGCARRPIVIGKIGAS